jgi:hypothetical protein
LLAEGAEPDRIALDAGGDSPIRQRFERDVIAEPGGNRCPRRALL